ncbi:MAG: aminotransferase class I/II-fold pyridoxal phosphate-dependent enzyme [Candidatus Brockarchaeota archaeon]|nr:aminotransferase class I/II-fold pyridoxal phosphate-dependent enzyme [Candidatus Brockarchaeota archaeon]
MVCLELETFHLERFQSTWEHAVEYNLAESGVQPLALEELLGGKDVVERFMKRSLGYVHTNGSPSLRRNISELYQDAGEENVLVTNGSSEANFLAAWSLLERGDEALVMLPNYAQVWGLAKMMGGAAVPLWLRNRRGWNLDLEEVKEKVSRKTKLVAICNPNNPTGAVIDRTTLRGICEIAEDAGSWVLCDEVYRGAELEGGMTPSVWGIYEKAIATSGLSKAFGLPGLRVGWILARKDVANRLWAYHDYTTICVSAASDFLASLALEADNKARILSRTRRLLTSNWSILERWFGRHSGIFACEKPKAGAVSFAKYSVNENSTLIAERLVREKGVLIVPGDHFLMDGYVRIGYGSDAGRLEKSLALVSDFFERLGKRIRSGS